MSSQGHVNYQLPPLGDSANQNQAATAGNPNVIQLDPLAPGSSNRRSLIQNQQPSNGASSNSAGVVQTVPSSASSAQQQANPVAYNGSENNSVAPGNNNFVASSNTTNATHANLELSGDRLVSCCFFSRMSRFCS